MLADLHSANHMLLKISYNIYRRQKLIKFDLTNNYGITGYKAEDILLATV